MYASVTASEKTEGKSTARQTTKGERSNGLFRKAGVHYPDSLARMVTNDASVGHRPGVEKHSASDRLSRLIQTGSIQTKLKISKPDDKMEQEADRTADSVMTAPFKSASLAIRYFRVAAVSSTGWVWASDPMGETEKPKALLLMGIE